MRWAFLKTLFVIYLMVALPASAQRIVDNVGNVTATFVADSELIHNGDLVGGTLRLLSPDGTLITGFASLIFENVHQVFIDGEMPPVRLPEDRYHWGTQTSTWDFWFASKTANGSTYAEDVPDWAGADTYISVRRHDVGGFFGPSREWQTNQTTELQDLSNLNGRAPITAIGGLRWYGDDSGFFLHESLWTNGIDVAHVVGAPGTTSRFQFEVLGSGIEDSNCGDLACFDFEITWPIPEPSSGRMLWGIFAGALMRRQQQNQRHRTNDSTEDRGTSAGNG